MPEPSKFKIDGKELQVNIKSKEEVALDWGGKLVFYSAIVGGAIDAASCPRSSKVSWKRWRRGR